MPTPGNVKWTASPPGSAGKFIPIIRAPERGIIRGIVVCPDLTGAMVHWDGQRCGPCIGDAHICPGCRARLPKKWVGYLGSWLPEPDRLVLFEITAEAYMNCQEIQDGWLPELRRWEVQLRRAKPHKTARVIVEFLHLVDTEAALPNAFDVRETLERIWSGTMRRSDRD